MVSNGELSGKLAARIAGDSEAIQSFFLQMLRINAVNPRMGGPGEAERAEFLDGFLREEGFSVERVDVNDAETGKKRPNLCVRVPGESPRCIWFVAHMDTVPEGSRELW